MNSIDPIIYKIPFKYYTGRKEVISENRTYYDDDEYMYVSIKRVNAVIEEDEIAYHYSGKVEIMNNTGFFSQFKDFVYVHKTLTDLIKYVWDSHVIVISKYPDHHRGFSLNNEGESIFYIDTLRFQTHYKRWETRPYIGNEESTTFDNMNIDRHIFYYNFSKYIYDINPSLNPRKIFNDYLGNLKLVDYNKYKEIMFSHPYKTLYPSSDMFDEVYDGASHYKKNKQEHDIKKLEAEIAKIEKLKYQLTADRFSL